MKFTFILPKKKDFLIFDLPNLFVIEKYINKKKFLTLEIRKKIINISILFISIFSRHTKKLSHNYIINYIKYADPKIIITYIDNNPFFFSLKKFFPNKKFICIQNGFSLFHINNYHKLKWDCDYFFCFSNQFKKIYKKIVNGKVITLGSMKNNMIKIQNEEKNKKNIITFISSFSNLDLYYKYNNKFYSKEEFFYPEKKIINFLINYCREKNFKLFIALKKSKEESLEKEFYQKLIYKKNIKDFYRIVKFSRKVDQFSSYKLIDKSKLSIYIDSTLGLESLGRGNKTVCFGLRKKTNKNLRFCFEKEIPDEGEFWINDYNSKKMTSILNRVLKMKPIQWKRILKKYHTKFDMYYDFNNKVFVETIKSLENKISTNDNIN